MKLLSAETNLDSAISVGNKPLVRVYNSDSSAVELTRKSSVGVTLGKYTIPAGKVIYTEKAYSDTLEGGASLKVTAVGYSEMMEIISLGGGSGSSYVTDNLMMYLDPDNYSGSGNWLDETSNNIDGTIYAGSSAPTYVSSSPKHFSFDGSNDYIQFDQTDFGTAFSLFAFINPTSAGTIRTLFGNTAAGGSANGITCFLNGWNTSNNKMYIEYGNGSSGTTINSGTNTITNGVWQAVTFTYDKGNNTGSLYNNTTLFASDTNVNIDSDLNRAFRMGRFGEGANPYWYPGLIGVYMIYNRALTAAEVEQNYNYFKDRYGL